MSITKQHMTKFIRTRPGANLPPPRVLAKKAALTLAFLVTLLTPAAMAIPFPQVSAATDAQTIVCRRMGPQVGGNECLGATEGSILGLATKAINVLSYLVGAISVIVIVIAGFMYVSSAGNPDKTKRAKDAILYAIVGIAVAFFAQLIVMIVLSSV